MAKTKKQLHKKIKRLEREIAELQAQNETAERERVITSNCVYDMFFDVWNAILKNADELYLDIMRDKLEELAVSPIQWLDDETKFFIEHGYPRPSVEKDNADE